MDSLHKYLDMLIWRGYSEQGAVRAIWDYPPEMITETLMADHFGLMFYYGRLYSRDEHVDGRWRPDEPQWEVWCGGEIWEVVTDVDTVHRLETLRDKHSDKLYQDANRNYL